MKPNDFYKKYANVPLEKRGVHIDEIGSSLRGVYILIEKADQRAVDTKKEIDFFIKIAEKYL